MSRASERAPVRDSWKTDHFELAAPYQIYKEMPRLAAICEQVYDSLHIFYRYELPTTEKFKIVFLDEEDYSNGFAIGFAGWVSIYLTSGDFALRGNPGWQANVLAHEISHLFSLRKLGYTSSYLGHYTSWTGYRKHGNVTGEFGPVPFDEESWLVEGLAQLGAEACGLDRWDALRDMLEREALFAGDLPSLLELKTFHQDSRRAELIYNQGYSFLRWIRLQLGREEWKNWIDLAADRNIHEATESAFHRDFSSVFSSWRHDREVHHRCIQSSSQTISKEQAGDHHYRIEAQRVWTQNGFYSLKSNPNDHGILRLYDPSGNILSENPNGLLWSSQSANRLLFGVNELGWKNMHRNVLYEIYPLGTEPHAIVPSNRVYSACANGRGIWVVYHNEGRNQVGLVNGDFIQDVSNMPNGLDPLEIECQDGLDYLVVSATHGSGRALYRIDTANGGIWTNIIGGPQEDVRNPVLRDSSLYYAADFTGVFQIYQQRLQSGLEARQVTQLRGGAFYPAFTANGLEYSVFQNGNYSRILGSDAKSEIPKDSWKDSSIADPLQKIHRTNLQPNLESTDRMQYLGWATQLAFMTGMPDLSDSVEVSGRVWSWVGASAFIFADPALQNMVELQVGSLGTQHSGAYANKPGYLASLGWTTSLFPADVSIQTQIQGIPLAPHGGTGFPDSIHDELSDAPWLTLLQLQGSFSRPITNQSGILGQVVYQGLGISDDKATEGQTVTILEQAQGILAMDWNSLEPGRRHYNSGISLQGGGGFQWIGVVPLYTGYSWTMPMVIGQVSFYENIARKLFGNLTLDVTSIHVSDLGGDDSPAQGWHMGVDVNTAVDVELPWGTSGIGAGKRRSLAWTNWELHFGYGLSYSDSVLSTSAATPARVRPGIPASRQIQQRNIPQLWADVNRDWMVQQNLQASMSWETLTLGNSRSLWQIGVSVPTADPEDWMLSVQVQL